MNNTNNKHQTHKLVAGLVMTAGEGSNVDAGLLEQVGDFHKRYDIMAWADPSVELVRVVGTGYGTPARVLILQL